MTDDEEDDDDEQDEPEHLQVLVPESLIYWTPPKIGIVEVIDQGPDDGLEVLVLLGPDNSPLVALTREAAERTIGVLQDALEQMSGG